MFNLSSDIILASQSPRRKQILEAAGITFSIISPEADETVPEGMDADEAPQYLAELKADIVARQRPDALIIAADTVVILQQGADKEILGKPEDAEDAKKMLAKLSGRMHRVVTGVCVQKGSDKKSFSAVTEVYFRVLSAEQIDYYVQSFNPLDKAGAYAIQEWIGIVGIEQIKGDYYNVMGLPAGELLSRLA